MLDPADIWPRVFRTTAPLGSVMIISASSLAATQSSGMVPVAVTVSCAGCQQFRREAACIATAWVDRAAIVVVTAALPRLGDQLEPNLLNLACPGVVVSMDVQPVRVIWGSSRPHV